ncbi:MAG: hypothetical protein AAGI23_18885 [Bacteroidota bacterium]
MLAKVRHAIPKSLDHHTVFQRATYFSALFSFRCNSKFDAFVQKWTVWQVGVELGAVLAGDY